MSRIIAFILVVYFSTLVVVGQERRIIFNSYTSKQGLSHTAISQILQDNNGLIWIATTDGLNKFDGYNFDNYFTKFESNKVVDNTFLSIIQPSEKEIWAATKFGGLKVLDLNTGNIISHPLDSVKIIARENARLFLTSKNKIFVRGIDGLLEIKDNKMSLYDQDIIAPITSYLVYEDIDHNLWIASSMGVYKSSDPTHQNYTYYPFPTELGDRIKNTISQIFRFDAHTILFGSLNEGIWKFDEKEKKLVEVTVKIPDGNKLNVTSFLTDELGYLWVGTYGSGIFVLKKTDSGFEVVQHFTAGVKPGTLGSNGINCMYKDKSGVIWIGTQDAGLFSYSPRKSRFPLYNFYNSDFMEDNHTNTFFVDKTGKWYIGSDSKGVMIYDPNTNEYYSYNAESNKIKLPNKFINGIYKDSYENLWVGSYGFGLFKVNETTGKVEKIELINKKNYKSNDKIIKIIPAANDNFWICTIGSGLWYYNQKTQEKLSFAPEEDADMRIASLRMWHVYQENDSILWIAHNTNGLERLNLKNGHSLSFMPGDTTYSKTSIPSNCVIQILPSPINKNEIWLATRHGLSKMNTQTFAFKNYDKSDGLPSIIISSIQFDNTFKLWMGTNNGMAKLDPETDNISTYNESYGLQSLNFVYQCSYKASDGMLFFGGNQGFNAFYPHQLDEDDYIPTVVLTKFSLYNKQVFPSANGPLREIIEEADSIYLDYNQNFFNFEFTTTDYSDPFSIKFFYRLQGFEEDWHQISGASRLVSYTNVPPGDYTFQVKSTTSDGLPVENIKEINVIITPPFWQTSYFVFGIVVFVLFVIWLIFRIRLNSLQQYNKRLEKKVSDRTAQLTLKTQQLEQSQLELKKLSLVASNTNNAVAITNLDGILYWSNTAFNKVYNIEHQSQELNSGSFNLLDYRKHHIFKQFFNECKQNNTAHFFESEIESVDGKIIPVNSNIIPLLNDSGQLLQIIVVDSDLTHIKEAQHQIEIQRDELLKSNATKDKLFSIIAHDLRSPIGNISRFLDLMVNYPDTLDNTDEIVRIMDKTAKATYHLLENLLIWSRSQRHEIGYHPNQNMLSSHINDTIHLFEGIAMNKGITITDFTNPEQSAWFDENLLRTILRNLISNAIKFTEANGQIKIHSLIHSNKLEVIVADTGIGMNAETLEKLFKVNLHFTTYGTNREKGQGLGLLLCKDLVEIGKGKIWVESIPEKGSKFHFTLPLMNPDE